MNAHRSIILLLLLGQLLFVGCRKDGPERPEDPIANTVSNGVFITNEGNFQWGNAKVSFYDIATATVVEDLYEPANGVGLGDVCQSMRLFNGKAYVVVNNSGKVVVVDQRTFVASATITGFVSPRHFLPVGNDKAYVSDLAANHISVVDLTTNTITGSIACPGWTEEMVLVNSSVFVTNESRSQLYVIDAMTDAMVDSIPVSRGGNSIVEDVEGKLWLACSGGGGTLPALYRIDAETRTVEHMFTFPNGSDNPWRLDINSDRDTLYFLNGDVFRMSVAAIALPTAAFVPADGRNFYGVGVEPTTGILYVSDAIDYVQRGSIARYAPNGSLLNTFLAGTVPGEFVFP